MAINNKSSKGKGADIVSQMLRNGVDAPGSDNKLPKIDVKRAMEQQSAAMKKLKGKQDPDDFLTARKKKK